jgi:hypothetical protein
MKSKDQSKYRPLGSESSSVLHLVVWIQEVELLHPINKFDPLVSN